MEKANIFTNFYFLTTKKRRFAPLTGCIGGRRRPKEEKTGRDFIQFSDATVSRRHFEIKYSDSKFYISDLGSAGGTFIRVVKESR